MKKVVNRRMLACVLSSLANAVLAQSLGATDGIVVTATRVATPIDDALRDVTVIDRAEIESSGASSFSELLRSVPGVQVTQDSVRGAVPSIYIRGTNTNHTLFLIDGQRVNSATAGGTAFQGIPLEQIERIEVLRGPSSSLYGADALGGVIQVFTRAGRGSSPAPNAYVGVGRYGTQLTSVGYGGQVNDTRFHFQAGNETTSGFSEIKASKPGIFDLYNADRDGYRQSNFSFNVGQKVRDDLSIGARFFQSNGVKHSDNANCDANYTVCSTQFDNREYQKIQTGGVHLDWKISPTVTTRIRYGQTVDRLESREYDPLSQIVTVPVYKTTQDQYGVQTDWKSGLGNFMFAWESRAVKVDSTKVLTVNRQDNDAVVLGYQGQFSAHSFQASVRHDKFTGMDSVATGSVGYGYRLNPKWAVRGSIGTAYHAPTFNDLYWPLDLVNFYEGNPNLRPEKSHNTELGLSYAAVGSSFSANIYQNKIKDMIAYYSDPVTYIGTMGNIGQASIKGVSLRGSKHWNEWQASAAYDWLDAKDDTTQKKLARRAPQAMSIGIDRTQDAWTHGLRMQAFARRYNDNKNLQELAGYAVLNWRTSYAIAKDWRIEATISNLLNKDYVVVRNTLSPYNDYAVAGRSLFVSARYAPK